MRTSRLITAIIAASLVTALACKKAKVVPPPASITIVHAMFGGNPIVPKFGSDTAGIYYVGSTDDNTLIRIGYGASQLYSPVAGTRSLSVVPITDTAFKIFNGNIVLQSGAIYSFFLSGDPAHADTLLVKDEIPYYADSAAGVRFANLSVGGKALTINLTSDPTHTPIATLGYRQLSGFLKYPASRIAFGSYTFDIRDQATGDSLTSYTWTYNRFRNRNNTIVIAGPTDLGNTPNVFSVANY